MIKLVVVCVTGCGQPNTYQAKTHHTGTLRLNSKGTGRVFSLVYLKATTMGVVQVGAVVEGYGETEGPAVTSQESVQKDQRHDKTSEALTTALVNKSMIGNWQTKNGVCLGWAAHVAI